MYQQRPVGHFVLLLLTIIITSLYLFVPVTASGFSFGGGCGTVGIGDVDGDPNCLPDNPLIIVPGPIGSPVRLVPFDEQTFLVADYSRKQLLWFDTSGNLTLFMETLGRPMSLAIQKIANPGGKIKERYYYVGNDDNRTIDVYFEKNDQFLLVGQYSVGVNGVQALDMVFNEADNLLYVVDGVEKNVKVVQLDGQLFGAFGTGVLVDPKGLALDQNFDNQKVYVSDYGDPAGYPTIDASIKVFNVTGSHLSSSAISGCGRFSRPQGLALHHDKIFVADGMLAEIMEFNISTGVKTGAYGCRGSGPGHLLLPLDIVLDHLGQNLYTADNRNMRITVLPLSQP